MNRLVEARPVHANLVELKLDAVDPRLLLPVNAPRSILLVCAQKRLALSLSRIRAARARRAARVIRVRVVVALRDADVVDAENLN